MVYISFAFLKEPLDKKVFEGYLNQLPLQMQEKVTRFRKWEDKTNSLLGKVMLNQCAASNFGISDILDQIVYNPHHRPEVNEPLSFSISHSGNMVVCAMSETCQLGIDVEQLVEFDFAPFQDYMSEKEWEQIHLAKDPNREFLKFWTQNEAVIKADGRGLSIPLNLLKVCNSKAKIAGTGWHLQEIKLHPCYICHLATDQKLDSQEVICQDFFL
ncbi:4'-phosphopantetheinyl transferase family protein [Algoriphagus boritolerans]|uniref:4'-phosphopantetheinyl transferase n=1 Tax=Algoriphagus boritolerans DSM 17298 = JCM 18970 TaxID=1120964 RepID=A0A1H6AM40_9BACT|nr:4'-phosphopantetheinyl transferase [Algoriphagus boritolerans DSM 17298 = JCM 18970]